MRLIGRSRPNSAKNPPFPRESQLLHQNLPTRSPSMSIPNQSSLAVNSGHRPYQTFSPSSSQTRTRPPLHPGVINLQQNNSDFLGDCKYRRVTIKLKFGSDSILVAEFLIVVELLMLFDMIFSLSLSLSLSLSFHTHMHCSLTLYSSAITITNALWDEFLVCPILFH